MLKDECAAVGIHLFQTSKSAVDSTMLEVPESAIKHMTYVSNNKAQPEAVSLPSVGSG